jgi:hypothetical protein
VQRIDQGNSGILNIVIPRHLILIIVVIKLIAPNIEEAPARWRLKITKSTAAPECARAPLKGTYIVHPVPEPSYTKLEINNNERAWCSNQYLKLFNLGKAISGAPIRIGTKKLPKPPIKIGITVKKIITKAWLVTIVLYNWLLPSKNCVSVKANSALINKEKDAPITPENAPKIKYKIPMSLWFVEYNHLLSHDSNWVFICSLMQSHSLIYFFL